VLSISTSLSGSTNDPFQSSCSGFAALASRIAVTSTVSDGEAEKVEGARVAEAPSSVTKPVRGEDHVLCNLEPLK
jgi:hypothetical protein